MTNEQIKEAISFYIIGLLASKEGYTVSKPNYDYGVDMMLSKPTIINISNKTHYLESGKTIGIQIKCTTEKQVIRTDNYIKFDLKIRNYNHLIVRRDLRNLERRYPLILIVVILDENEQLWINQNFNDFSLNIKCSSYWFYPDEKDNLSKNKQTIRISIPQTNEFDTNFLTNIFNSIS